mmetsp:Transcript_38689/g.48878  ORF Transcript_38689/g.48878 Transcript_38689/m.48878 type:complete len:384 (+) Transcript_38689:235-1386(+)
MGKGKSSVSLGVAKHWIRKIVSVVRLEGKNESDFWDVLARECFRRGSGKLSCSYCNSGDHIREFCPLFCRHWRNNSCLACGLLGHYSSTCTNPKFGGVPDSVASVVTDGKREVSECESSGGSFDVSLNSHSYDSSNLDNSSVDIGNGISSVSLCGEDDDINVERFSEIQDLIVDLDEMIVNLLSRDGRISSFIENNANEFEPEEIICGGEHDEEYIQLVGTLVSEIDGRKSSVVGGLEQVDIPGNGRIGSLPSFGPDNDIILIDEFSENKDSGKGPIVSHDIEKVIDGHEEGFTANVCANCLEIGHSFHECPLIHSDDESVDINFFAFDDSQLGKGSSEVGDSVGDRLALWVYTMVLALKYFSGIYEEMKGSDCLVEFSLAPD